MEDLQNPILGTAAEIRSQIRKAHIQYAGNKILKIYGLLNCASGKRMKRENRVFFSSIQAAENLGYRPCGHCCKQKYKKWKDEFI